MSQDVVFRRIRGRIVPMRLTKQQKENLKGVSIAGSGAALALGGASVYKRSVVASASFAKKAFDLITPSPSVFGGGNKKFRSSAQMSFDDVLKKTANTNSDKAFRTASKLASLSKAVRTGSALIGGGLFVYGAAKIANANKKKQVSPEVAAFYGAIGGGVLKKAIPQAQKVFEVGLQPRQQKFKFASNMAIDALKNFGSKYLK